MLANFVLIVLFLIPYVVTTFGAILMVLYAYRHVKSRRFLVVAGIGLLLFFVVFKAVQYWWILVYTGGRYGIFYGVGIWVPVLLAGFGLIGLGLWKK